MLVLDARVHLVNLQFSFSNWNAVPGSLRFREQETFQEHVERKNNSSGSMAIVPTENVSLADFIWELEDSGYELVDAFCQERINSKDPSGKNTYPMVRFLYARSEHVRISDKFKSVRAEIRDDLQNMVELALWRVRAFSNPFYREGKEIPGEIAFSFNMEARTPLFLPDGRPVVRWEKDEEGNRLGDAPVPLRAEYFLDMIDGNIGIINK